jgi:hypothetical protein
MQEGGSGPSYDAPMLRTLVSAAVTAALAFVIWTACDSSRGLDPAPSSSSGTASAAAPLAGARLSRAGETCGSTGECEEPLRCVQAVCVSAQTSRLGEYHWAAGQAAVERGLPSAADHFQQAVTQFDADKQPVPAALLCDYGAALRRAGDPKGAEQAARLLHRCLLAAATGSAEHARALRELAALAPRGLDPSLLGRDAPADRYLTAEPAKAPVDALKVDVARSTKASDRGYEAFAKKLEGAEGRPVLQKCFASYWNDTMATKLVARVTLKNSARFGDDDAYVGGTAELTVEPGANPAESAALDCLRAGLAPLADAVAKSGAQGSFSGGLTVTLTAGP